MYINYVIDENKNIYISYWLLLITFLVALMIVVGGLTRLTNSGLSITNWDLISGIIPPLSVNDWESLFALYKQIPQYKFVNFNMTLNEFKVIYWWEYLHRLLGRLIGILFLLPLLYFSYIKILKKSSLFNLYFIFILIAFQGFIGWYMVESGLSERTDVSQYRLSLHLTLAFIIFVFLLWNYFNFSQINKYTSENKLPFLIPIIFLILILVQISIGGFVSGLDAGKIYQTWPLMNQYYFPDDSNFNDLFNLNAFETPSLVQFIHRNLAYLIFFFFVYMFLIIFKNKKYFYLRKITIILAILLVLQIFLGIAAIVSDLHIAIASMHQIGSIMLVIITSLLVYKNSN